MVREKEKNNRKALEILQRGPRPLARQNAPSFCQVVSACPRADDFRKPFGAQISDDRSEIASAEIELRISGKNGALFLAETR